MKRLIAVLPVVSLLGLLGACVVNRHDDDDEKRREHVVVEHEHDREPVDVHIHEH